MSSMSGQMVQRGKEMSPDGTEAPKPPDVLNVLSETGQRATVVEWQTVGDCHVYFHCISCNHRLNVADSDLAKANHTGHQCLMVIKGPL